MKPQKTISPTETLFRQNTYLCQCRGTVTGVQKDTKGVSIILDRTVFYPEGGGQPSDRGEIVLEGKTYTVDHVKDEGGILLHHLSGVKNPEGKNLSLSETDVQPDLETDLSHLEGREAELTIDWEYRFANMQRHLGEHILSGAFYRLFGFANAGFHMGEDYITIDVKTDGSALTWNMVLEAEREANRVIWADLPVTVRFFENKEEALAMPTRKEVAFSEDIFIVTVGDEKDPADCVACCGTHPSSSGQVGLVKAYKVEKNKDLWRVYFDAGRYAMEKLDAVYEAANTLAVRHSTSPEDLLSRMEKEEAKQQETHEELKRLRQWMGDHMVEELGDITKARAAENPAPFTELVSANASAEDISRISKRLQKAIAGTLVLRFPEENTVLLFSDGTEESEEAGKLVKEHALPLGGRGGGSKEFARVVFETGDAMESFLKTIRPEK